MVQHSPRINDIPQSQALQIINIQYVTSLYGPICRRAGNGLETCGGSNGHFVVIKSMDAGCPRITGSHRMQAAAAAYIQKAEILQISPLEEIQQSLFGDVSSLGGKTSVNK